MFGLNRLLETAFPTAEEYADASIRLSKVGFSAEELANAAYRLSKTGYSGEEYAAGLTRVSQLLAVNVTTPAGTNWSPSSQ
mgnify:CR=1 FL=1